MAAPGVRWSGDRCRAVMGLSYVEDVHLELHDNIPEDVHLVAEATLVKDVVAVQLGGPEPVCIIYVCSFFPASSLIGMHFS